MSDKTTGKHFEDLTKIDVPFDELDQVTQWALRGAKNDGEIIQCFGRHSNEWGEVAIPHWVPDTTYRLKPTPVEETRVVDAWVHAGWGEISSFASDAPGWAAGTFTLKLIDGKPVYGEWVVIKQNEDGQMALKIPQSPNQGDEVENHQTWTWCAERKCWEFWVPHRLYPTPDGGFVVSTNDCWHDGSFPTFEAAEAEALDLPDFTKPNEGVDAPSTPHDIVNEMIREFNAKCENEGHHFTASSISPNTDYCQACGATRARISEPPQEKTHD